MDIREFLTDRGISFKENQQSYILTCPNCSKPDKLYIRKLTQNFICFFCADSFKGGRPDRALAALSGEHIQSIDGILRGSTPQAVDRLQIKLNDPYNSDVSEYVDDRPTVNFPNDFVHVTNVGAQEGVKYLESRGVSLEIASQYNLYYSTSQQRVIFPVEEDGRLFGWQGRTIRDGEYIDRRTGERRKIPKMLGSKNTPLHRCLMFSDRLYGQDHVVICEGPIDAIKCHLIGGNIATMGKAVTDDQINLLRRLPVTKVYVALDPDAAVEINQLIKYFSDREVFLLMPPSGLKDLGEATMEQVYEQFLHAPKVTAGHIFPFLKVGLKDSKPTS